MTRQSVRGLIFSPGEVRTCIGYDVSQATAQLHSDGLGLLPKTLYVTFDDFLSVAKCSIAWRRQDDISVVFEEWVDDPLHRLH